MTPLTEHAVRVAKGLPDDPARAREIVRGLAKAGLCRRVVPRAYGGHSAHVRVEDLCRIRSGLAYVSPLADALFAMQGLGSYPISLAGTDRQKRDVLPRVARGEAIAAFALTEPQAGSDAAAIATRARRRGRSWILDGEKAFASNAGIATDYVLFARTGRGPTAFYVRAEDLPPGAVRPLELISPHPIGTIVLNHVEIPASARVGREGSGLEIALETLAVFRPTVGAAACGMARRALDEAVRYARARRQFGRPIASFQATRFRIADMATRLRAAEGLVERAAKIADRLGRPDRAASAMAKLFATEAAQEIVDAALQIHGGIGLVRGHILERLYRDVRALRIYEGTSEIQRLVIARAVLGDS
jgi:acyl-CoA dehydrogenase